MSDRLKITDERNGQQYEAPIKDGAIRALDLRKIKTGPEDFGMLSYDPAFQNTASCRSAVAYIDGDQGVLRYRGYPIEELAENCSFLEVAWLLLNGELPTYGQMEIWEAQVKRHTMLHELSLIHIYTRLQLLSYQLDASSRDNGDPNGGGGR